MCSDGAKIDRTEKNSSLIEKELFKIPNVESTPQKVSVLLTSECKLNCLHCDKVDHGKGELPETALKKIYKILPSALSMEWHGGDILEVPHFERALSEVLSGYPHLEHIIMSCGIGINEKWAELLASERISLNFTLDSPNMHVNTYIRKHRYFEEFSESVSMMNNAYAAKNIEPNMSLSAVLMRSNMETIKDFPEFCRKNGFRRFVLDYIRSKKAGLEDILLDRDEDACRYMTEIISEIEKEFQDMGIEFEYTFKRLLSNTSEVINDVPNSACSRVISGGIMNIRCSIKRLCEFPWKQVFINYDGTLSPDFMCTVPAGNLIEDDFEDIWNGPDMLEYRERMISGNVRNWCSEQCISKELKDPSVSLS